MLSSAFIDGSRQEEKVNIEKYDRFESDSFLLKDHGFKMYLFSYQAFFNFDDNGKFQGAEFDYLTPEIGSYWLTHYFPCDEDDTACIDSEDGYQ